MALKSAIALGGYQGDGGNQQNDIYGKSNPIIPQPAVRDKAAAKLNRMLTEAHQRQDYKTWWRVYCRLHGIAWPPTGLGVKLATMREADNYAQLKERDR